MSDYESYEAARLQMFVGTRVTTVGDARPGLLILLDGLEPIFKSEYGDNDGKLDIYCSTGEFWHGDYDIPCVEAVIE